MPEPTILDRIMLLMADGELRSGREIARTVGCARSSGSPRIAEACDRGWLRHVWREHRSTVYQVTPQGKRHADDLLVKIAVMRVPTRTEVKLPDAPRLWFNV